MRKINLILIDYDERYLNRLNEYLSLAYKGKFEINCFTSKETFLDYIKELRYRDILVINKDMYEESLQNLGMKAILYFVEGNIENEQKDTIHKYKDINIIDDKVITAFIESDPQQLAKINSNNTEAKIIAVYSPIGGSGKSIIAASLSNVLADEGNCVFYLNIEDVQSTDLYFSGDKYTSLSDVILEIKDRSEDYIQKLIASTNIDRMFNVSYLNPIENILDIEDMTEEDIKWLLEGIINTKKYNYIVVDMGSKFNSIYREVLNISDYVISPILNDVISNIKLERFIADINNINKYYFVFNRCEKGVGNKVPQYLSRLGINVEVTIRENKSLRNLAGRDVINIPEFKNSIYRIIVNLDL